MSKHNLDISDLVRNPKNKKLKQALEERAAASKAAQLKTKAARRELTKSLAASDRKLISDRAFIKFRSEIMELLAKILLDHKRTQQDFAGRAKQIEDSTIEKARRLLIDLKGGDLHA